MVHTTVFEDCGSRRISYRTIDCNDAIYGEFKTSKCWTDLLSFFSNEELQEHTIKSEPFCENMKLENDNGEFVCVYFGQVDRYDTVNKFVDFYDNRHNIIQKSVYHRKYHIQNTIFDKCKRYNIQISTND